MDVWGFISTTQTGAELFYILVIPLSLSLSMHVPKTVQGETEACKFKNISNVNQQKEGISQSRGGETTVTLP